MAGQIRLDRKIMQWEWYQDVNVCHLFIHLILSANYKDGEWQGKQIKRGQLITGLDKLATTTGLSVMQLRTCFDKLKKTNEITYTVTSKYRIITVCKYDSYQSEKALKTTKVTSKVTGKVTGNITSEQQASNKPVTANNKENKENKENKIINKENKESLCLFKIETKPIDDAFWEDVKIDFYNSYQWIEKVCRDKQISIVVFKEKAREFISDIELRDQTKDLKELKNHFINWYNKKITNGTTDKQHQLIRTNFESMGADASAERIKSRLDAVARG